MWRKRAEGDAERQTDIKRERVRSIKKKGIKEDKKREKICKAEGRCRERKKIYTRTITERDK
jgi:hypothetical protein